MALSNGTILVSFTSQDKEIKSVDVKSSTVFWLGKSNGQHSGNITLKEGNLEFYGDNLAGGSFVMDMTLSLRILMEMVKEI